jgi:hypothetical protein
MKKVWGFIKEYFVELLLVVEAIALVIFLR